MTQVMIKQKIQVLLPFPVLSIQTLSQFPAGVRSSCSMANNYLHGSDYLKHGFPLFVVDDQGSQKKLLSFEQVKKQPSIMQQPDGYKVYSPGLSNLNR